jgi:hypothetical protein
MDAERLAEIRERAGCLCSACSSLADGEVLWPRVGEWQPYCNNCMRDYHAEADNTDADEMRKFGGAYGLCPRPQYRTFDDPIPDLLAEVERLTAELNAERANGDALAKALQRIFTTRNRVESDYEALDAHNALRQGEKHEY